MSQRQYQEIETPIGKHAVDAEGSPIGVVRMDPEKSYADIGLLLQDYINHHNPSAWQKITEKIDYTYNNLDQALRLLEAETNFNKEIQQRLKKGQKLLFKPNLVGVQNIDPQTHGPGLTSTMNTEWAFIAALMRWFHDKAKVSYHQMTLGEAATIMPSIARVYSMVNPSKQTVTVEAALEGKAHEFYGGWGFYFVRKYLAETLEPGAGDDPMNGYEESVSGTYIPPGLASDKLMVYDLNRIFDDPTKGRDIRLPDGVNYTSITLHKAIVGGNPQDPKDMQAYPGSILINVPKFKVHAITLFTNIIKNLGIGLYPMQSTKTGDHQWEYSVPHNIAPGMKGGIPHEVWVPDMDENTHIPKRDASGNYMAKKTGGINATMVDIIQAVQSQDIFMMHVVDGIEAINYDHTGTPAGTKTPEGMVFAGLDPVAADLLCARYMFSNVPMGDAIKTGIDDGHGGRFPQKVPVPKLVEKNIVAETGYDCPLSRDASFKKAEERKLGKRKYYVVGHDHITDAPIVSVEGHLGFVKNGKFEDLITQNLFFDVYKLPWDMQKTAFAYMDAVDTLEGSNLKQDFLNTFDENGDGIVTYDEFGKKGIWGYVLYAGGRRVSVMSEEPFGYLKAAFDNGTSIKHSDSSLNPDGHTINRDLFLAGVFVTAYFMSQLEEEIQDPFYPGLTCGKGNWPSFTLAKFIQIGGSLYGKEFPNRVIFPSLYGAAFRYADLTQNNGKYTGDIRNEPTPDALDRYISEISANQKKPLDFTFFVPEGYESVGGFKMPNVEITSDPTKVLTAVFNGGAETWG
jgi:hypothetical protein